MPKARIPQIKTPESDFKLDNNIANEFKKYKGQPNMSRKKRALISKSNPHHLIFGNTLPVWKTWQTYAQNMGLLEDDTDTQTN